MSFHSSFNVPQFRREKRFWGRRRKKVIFLKWICYYYHFSPFLVGEMRMGDLKKGLGFVYVVCVVMIVTDSPSARS